MPLKAKLTKDEFENLPDVLKSEYVERNGQYMLEVDGLVDRGALESERNARATAARQAQELKDKIGDMDIDAAREGLKKLRALEEKGLLDAGKIDEVIAARTAAMQADHDNQVKAFKAQIGALESTNSTLTGELEKLTIHSALKSKAAEKGARSSAIDDVIARFTVTGIDGIRWQLRDGRVVALKGDQVVYGKSAADPMTFDEGFELLAQRAPHLFEESSGGGARNSRDRGANSFTISREEARNPQRYQLAKEQAQKAGQELVIQ